MISRYFKLFLFLLILFFLLLVFFKDIKIFLSQNLSETTKFKINKIINKKKYLNEKIKYLVLSNYEKKRYNLIKKNTDNIKINSKNKNIILKTNLKKKISSDFIKDIKIYFLPFKNYKDNKGKPSGFFFNFKNELYLVTGNANFYKIFFNKEKNQITYITKIDSDIKKELDFQMLDKEGEASIKGVVVNNFNNTIYVSSTNQKYPNCYNLKIIELTLKNNFFNSKKFFENDDCIKKEKGKRFSILQGAGGHMIDLEDKILFSTGDYGNYESSQNYKSTFGKVLSIDKKDKKMNLLSLGHRNIQGMHYDMSYNVLISSEMGPKGGDEININFKPFINNPKNYGWPISSYGYHYDNKTLKIAPLYKSHKKYGFIEPVKYWNPSIAPTKIQKINQYLKIKNNYHIYLLSTLGYRDQIKDGDQSLHLLYFENNYKKIFKINQIEIGERIRDYIFFNNHLILMFESLPAIGLAKLK